MPLSKKRNAELMRKLRYNRRPVSPAGSNSVVPKQVINDDIPDAASPVTSPAPATWLDADGNTVYE